MLNLLQEAHPFAVSIPHVCVTVHAECLHGMWMPWDNAKAATFFPQPIGLAATWDTDFMEEVAGMISEEMRAINNEQYKQDKTYRYCIACLWPPIEHHVQRQPGAREDHGRSLRHCLLIAV